MRFGEAGSDVVLPLTFVSSKYEHLMTVRPHFNTAGWKSNNGFAEERDCAIEIKALSTGSNTFTWYRIWETAVAVHSFCGRSERSGGIMELHSTLS